MRQNIPRGNITCLHHKMNYTHIYHIAALSKQHDINLWVNISMMLLKPTILCYPKIKHHNATILCCPMMKHSKCYYTVLSYDQTPIMLLYCAVPRSNTHDATILYYPKIKHPWCYYTVLSQDQTPMMLLYCAVPWSNTQNATILCCLMIKHP